MSGYRVQCIEFKGLTFISVHWEKLPFCIPLDSGSGNPGVVDNDHWRITETPSKCKEYLA